MSSLWIAFHERWQSTDCSAVIHTTPQPCSGSKFCQHIHFRSLVKYVNVNPCLLRDHRNAVNPVAIRGNVSIPYQWPLVLVSSGVLIWLLDTAIYEDSLTAPAKIYGALTSVVHIGLVMCRLYLLNNRVLFDLFPPTQKVIGVAGFTFIWNVHFSKDKAFSDFFNKTVS